MKKQEINSWCGADGKRSIFVTACLVVLLCASVVAPRSGAAEPEKSPATPTPASVAAQKLPRVLILGDSISLGYTELVRKNLEGVAEVRRPATNCQHTAFGLQNIEKWLGDGQWDVIHFNWGIWDTHLMDAQGHLVRDEVNTPGPLKIRHTTEQYAKNLEQLVQTMEKTGARLVWAATTPVMYRTGDRFQAIVQNNQAAAELMKRRGVAINDLYAFVLPQAKQWQTGDRVHFNATGNQALAKQVSAAIAEALKQPKPPARNSQPAEASKK